MATNSNEILEKKHPEYNKMLPEWQFYYDTYTGGRKWYEKNIFKYFKEGPEEYSERMGRAYRFNHTREVVDLVNKYIYKAEISRSDEVPNYVKEFWKNASLQKKDIKHFMESASALSSVYGKVWIVVDTNKILDQTTVLDAKNNEERVYCYTVSPEDVLDLSFDDDGELNWIKIVEYTRDDTNPLDYTGKVSKQIRIWTREGWILFKYDSDETKVSETTSGLHGLGIVPVTWLDHNETGSLYSSTSLIADAAYLDRAAANYLSNIDAIIQDQTFSQLVIPSEGINFSGDESSDAAINKMLEFGTKRIFLFGGTAENKPSYISPDIGQPQFILSVVNKIIGEIYHSVGMSGERTKEDNAMGIDNSSGVAKAYDFERMNAMLANKAQSIEFCENRIVNIVKAWYGEKSKNTDIQEYVTYSRDFDVRNLSNEFDISLNLGKIMAPKSLKRLQIMSLVDKLYPQLSEKLKSEIKKEVEGDWLDVIEAQANAAGTTAKPNLPKQTGKQGQNNKSAS